MSMLLELAERCEAATGPDCDLAIAINEALGIASYITDDGDPTASLDAAMTLYVRVPERVPSDPRKASAEALRQRAEHV